MPTNKLKRFTRSKESLKSKDSDRSKKSDGSKSSEKSKKSDMSRESVDRSADSDNPNVSTDIDAAPARPGSNMDITERVDLKIVVLGDWQVGKSSLIVYYTTGRFDRQEKLISLNCTNEKVLKINDKGVNVKLQDTGYTNTPHVWNDMRDSFGADIFLVCYSVNNRESFDNVWNKWIPALDTNFSNVPRILVGCKKDLRDSVYDSRKLANFDLAKQTATQYGMEYKEISLLEPESVAICLERALELGLRWVINKNKKNSKSCIIS